MSDDRLEYRTYLLRLWAAEASDANGVAWRAALENPRTGERWGFANLEQLFAFLMDQTETATWRSPRAM